MPEPVTPSVIDRLRAATEGLQFPSEADYPIEPVVLENSGDEPLSPQKLLQLTGHDGDTPVRTYGLADFFEPVTREQEWHNAQERATVQRFTQLVETLSQLLRDVKVYKIGEVESVVYVIGKTDTGSPAGVKTRVVET